MDHHSLIAAALLCLQWFAAVGENDTRLPVPDDAALKQAIQLVSNLYRADHEAAKTPEQKKALAKKLLQVGKETKDDDAGKFALFLRAGDIAAGAGDVATAFSAIGVLEKEYLIDELAMRAEALTKASKTLETPKEHQEFAPKFQAAIREAVSKDRFDLTELIQVAALESARKARSGDLVKQVVAQGKKVEAQASEYAKIKSAIATLQTLPTDPAANALVGKYRCFFKDDWDHGILMLALGDNEQLSTLAAQELEDKPPALMLGDGWWALAESLDGQPSEIVQARGRHWYRKALPSLTGLAKAAVESKMSETTGKEDDPPKPSKEDKDEKIKDKISDTLPGTFQVVAQSAKSNERLDSFYEFRADGSILRDKSHAGMWEVSGGQVKLRLTDSSYGTIRVNRDQNGFSGHVIAGDKKWNLQGVRLTVVAVWSHQAGSGKPWKLHLWSNGRINAPDGRAKWSANGNTLVLSWPEGWIDKCTISADGRRYEGKNQNGTVISGTRTTAN